MRLLFQKYYFSLMFGAPLYFLLFLQTSLGAFFTENVGDVTLQFVHSNSIKGTKWNINGTNITAYLGIPYAKPPVGNLRFASPVVPDPWVGELDATKPPPTCWQYIFGGFDLENPAAKVWINNTEMSEDCLYLNVWTPGDGQELSTKLPVMVWIYGGGYFSGSSTLDVYDGRFLAALENVVVVSMQYRLGPFGFLYIKSQVGGNMGLLDQQLALKWVQNYISLFNGDPNDVTIFGESAGAASVGLQYLAPSSRVLFKRFIMQSAGPLNRWALSTISDAHDAGVAVRYIMLFFHFIQNLEPFYYHYEYLEYIYMPYLY